VTVVRVTPPTRGLAGVRPLLGALGVQVLDLLARADYFSHPQPGGQHVIA